MNTKAGLIILLVFLNGCRSSVEETIPTAIPRQALVELLADIHLAQAKTDLMRNADTTLNTSAVISVLQQHHIPAETYTATMDYFGSHPDALSKLYDEVIAELSRRQIEHQGVRKKIKDGKNG